MSLEPYRIKEDDYCHQQQIFQFSLDFSILQMKAHLNGRYESDFQLNAKEFNCKLHSQIPNQNSMVLIQSEPQL